MKNYLLFIVIIFVGFIFYAVLTQVSKSSKSKRVECQTKTTTFEKIFLDKPVEEAIKVLKNGNYKIVSTVEYSKYMKSNLINILTKEKADDLLKEVLVKNLSINQNSNEKLTIEYYVYENDKEDTNKKNSEAKSYAGYLMFEFKYNNELIYKIQTDYKNIDASDIKERMDCVVNSFISIN